MTRRACEHCLQYPEHATGCPFDSSEPELTVCADCGEEEEDVERCSGDKAPDGADCKAGLYYCRPCYLAVHVAHEDSDDGEAAREMQRVFKQNISKALAEEYLLARDKLVQNVSAHLQHMAARVQHVTKELDALKVKLERRNLWKTIKRWFWPAK